VRRQLDLFSARQAAPAFDARFATARRETLPLDAWIEHAPGWLSGHDALFDELERTVRWRSERRPMYDRVVDVPRLVAGPEDAPPHPLLEAMRAALSARHAEDFVRVSFAFYRGGDDSVAWHGDTVARELPRALVATVSLGARRRFLMRPTEGGAARAWMLGGGDLFVMGGTAQRAWRHAVPKVAEAGPRIAIMFRPAWGNA
jgi:alkylated DNA repair dioxygenase AlkB